MPVKGQMEHGYFVINRLFPYFVALCASVFCAFPSLSLAETIPATSTPTYNAHAKYTLGSCSKTSATELGGDHQVLCPFLGVAAVSAIQCQLPSSCSTVQAAVTMSYVCPNGGTMSSYQCWGAPPSCPAGQNWTLSGSNCTRPDCVAPAVRDGADGVCKVPNSCDGKETQPPVTGWYPSAVGTPSLESSQYCSGGCTVALNASPTGTQYANKTTRWQQYSQVQLGYSCAAGLGTVPAAGLPEKSPPEPPKPPLCRTGDGVLTSSTGAVHCVPSGTPGSAPPIVSKTQETQNFPDGSKKITDTTTTRDPQTGAEVKNKDVTNTPSNGGGPGEAGPPGTTNNKTASSTNDGGDPTKPGDSDFCAKNSGLQICKGGISEEKTQLEIRDINKEIKDLLDPKDPANTDSVDQEKNAYEEKATAHKDFIDAFAAKAQNDEGFLSWAWIPEVPASSCVPFSGVVGGKTITLDWCDKLGMIRDIAGYMFYILTAFGLFRIFANSTGATS